MQPTDELTTTLNRYFQWNKVRMDWFVGILIGLLKLRTINLTELAIGFPSAVKPESQSGPRKMDQELKRILAL
ncbi:MAG: hypothetical protein LM523_06885 [Candidatus Contendobacter sp.]|nr:hypothetical protein [Candidatus Contendobacter sp.]